MEIPTNLIYGFPALAQILGVTANALYVRRHRGTLDIEPIGRIGRMDVFDRAQVLAYAKHCKDSKGNQGKA